MSILKRIDAFKSLISGIGTSVDPTTDRVFAAGSRRSPEYYLSLYHYSSMARRLCTIYPDWAFKKGVTFSEDFPEWDDLDLANKVHNGLALANACGGAGIFVGADDGLSVDQPLGKVRGVSFCEVITRKELKVHAYYKDPKHPKYGQPMQYVLRQANTLRGRNDALIIHESRIVRMPGAHTERSERINYDGWDIPLLRVMEQELSSYGAAWGVLDILLNKSGMSVVKVQDFWQMVMSNASDDMATWATSLSTGHSTLRPLVMGEQDNIEVINPDLSSQAAVIDRICLQLAAVANVPLVILLGQSPSGFSAGEAELKWFMSSVEAYRNRIVAPRIRQLISYFGREIDFEFPPLTELSQLEQAQAYSTELSAHLAAARDGVLLADEIRAKYLDGYGGLTIEDLNAIDAIAETSAVAQQESATGQEPTGPNDQPVREGADQVVQDPKNKAT